jgi:hypothetical protein
MMGFGLEQKIKGIGTDPGKQMRGTGQGEVKRPPNHDELTAARHPNSKSRLGGSKSYAGGTPFRNSQRFRLRYKPSMRKTKSGCGVLFCFPQFLAKIPAFV